MSVYSVLCLFCIHLVQLNTIKIHTYSVHIIVLILSYNVTIITILFHTIQKCCAARTPSLKPASNCKPLWYACVSCIMQCSSIDYKSLLTY